MNFALNKLVTHLPKFVGGPDVTPGCCCGTTIKASNSDSAEVDVEVEFLDFEPRSDELKGVGVTVCELCPEFVAGKAKRNLCVLKIKIDKII